MLRSNLLRLTLLLPSVTTAAALAGPPQSRRRHPPARPSAAEASPAASENAVLQVAQPMPLSITYATESSCVESWLSARRHEPAFGFDTETRPAFRKGVVFAPATLQLSTATDCLVVHLAHLEAPWPAALVEVLASPETLMCGLGIDDDAVELWLHHGLEVFGRVELLRMPGASKGSSLAGLAETLLGVRLGKTPLAAVGERKVRPGVDGTTKVLTARTRAHTPFAMPPFQAGSSRQSSGTSSGRTTCCLASHPPPDAFVCGAPCTTGLGTGTISPGAA